MQRRQATLLALGCLIMSPLLAEIGLHFYHKIEDKESLLRQRHGTYFDHDYFVYDAQLGYRPPSDSHDTARYSMAGHDIYDVAYRTDHNGVRKTPCNLNSHLSYVFLGCGMTFGEGLEDYETLPATFSGALDYRYHVVNLGVNGYGPHHALRAVESGHVEKVTHSDIACVYYETQPSHMVRSFTHPDWDLVGPAYHLTRGGKDVEYSGPIHSLKNAQTIEWMRDHIKSFSVAREATKRYWQKDHTAMLWLYLQIIKKSKKIAEQELQAEYKVILWDEPYYIGEEDMTDSIIHFMNRESINYYLVSDILGTKDFKEFQIPYDGHPNFLANLRIGKYLAKDWHENI